MDKDEKTVMVLDPTETDVMDEMKIKHENHAKKFQRRFCSLFNNYFGNGLVDTDGWKFLYPLVVQHEPCSGCVSHKTHNIPSTKTHTRALNSVLPHMGGST